ncbi:MAG TPA: hypothetical protein VLA12_11265, partial [Planctomycetaceae bacterium]|nr:hypothetical protein [Planctomycetaceae bacterium]
MFARLARNLSIALCLAPGFLAAAELVVTPGQVQFADAYSRTQMLVSADGHDVTRQVGYHVADSTVARVDASGSVVPVGVGATELQITSSSDTKTIPIRVTKFNQQRQIDFATEIEPLLTRYGCNSGGCHGKSTGQNGFKLSLLGFDADFDYQTLVNESRGRRLFRLAPRNSMLLRKATGQSPHGGGKRFEVESEPYQMLLSWIDSGAPASRPDDARSVSIRMEPPEAILTQQGHQQLRVIA